jgi:hypothetical protein
MNRFTVRQHNHIHQPEDYVSGWWCVKYNCRVCDGKIPEKCFIVDTHTKYPNNLVIVCSELCLNTLMLQHL